MCFYTKRVAVSPCVNLHLRPPPSLFPDNADESAKDGFSQFTGGSHHVFSEELCAGVF